MEVTLFNKTGRPVAYLAEDGETIYLWDGRATAYIHKGKVYGWNGKHLGWMANGTIFDIYGLRSGFVRSKSPIVTHAEPIKPMKQIKQMKNVRQVSVVKPILCYGYSQKNLEAMLEEGIVL